MGIGYKTILGSESAAPVYSNSTVMNGDGQDADVPEFDGVMHIFVLDGDATTFTLPAVSALAEGSQVQVHIVEDLTDTMTIRLAEYATADSGFGGPLFITPDEYLQDNTAEEASGRHFSGIEFNTGVKAGTLAVLTVSSIGWLGHIITDTVGNITFTQYGV